MALKYLIDESVVIRIADDRIQSVLRALLLAGEIGRCSVTDLQIGFHARNEREWNAAIESVSVFEKFEVNNSHLKRGHQIQRLLAEKSIRLYPIFDLIVAAVAEEQGLTLLHCNGNFDLIAEVTGQSCQWVVPPGEIS